MLLSLPVDILESIIVELIARGNLLSVKTLSLVCSSLTYLCQQHLLSHITIVCPKADTKSKLYHRSSISTLQLIRDSPHLIPLLRALTIVDSGDTWYKIDYSLIALLQSLSHLKRFSWICSTAASSTTHWGALPDPLKNAIKSVIQRPSLNVLMLQFTDPSRIVVHQELAISPYLTRLIICGPGFSKLTFNFDHNNPGYKDRAILPVRGCMLEWIDDESIFFGWTSNTQPLISISHLRKFSVGRCKFNNAASVDVSPWESLVSQPSFYSTLEELWFEVSFSHPFPIGKFFFFFLLFPCPPTLCLKNSDIINPIQLPTLRKLGLTAILRDIGVSTFNLLTFIAQIFETMVLHPMPSELTHVALAINFPSTALVLHPSKMPWLRLDAAIAALPVLSWVGLKVFDSRRETFVVVPENPETMLPSLAERGVLHIIKDGLDFS